MINRRQLATRWVHSHEEDTDDTMVYRAASSDYQFPPARGRYSFILRRDGTYVVQSPGADDRPEHRTGSWKVDSGGRRGVESGDKLVLESDDTGRQVLEVADVADDVIKIKRDPTTAPPS